MYLKEISCKTIHIHIFWTGLATRISHIIMISLANLITHQTPTYLLRFFWKYVRTFLEDQLNMNETNDHLE